MVWSVYVRKGFAYIPTVARTEAGFHLEIEPVQVIPVENAAALERALAETISRGNPTVPTPMPSEALRPVVLAHVNVRSWSAFVKSASAWHVENEKGRFVIAPLRAVEHGNLVQDRETRENLPEGTPLDVVVRRVIERITAQPASE